MDALGFFLKQHAHLHAPGVGETEGASFEDLVLRELDEDHLRLRPREGLNSIAWLVWHMARAEDVLVNVVIAGGPQLLDQAQWRTRLKVTRGDIGTGMTDAEVSELSAAVDIPALRAYRAAVGRRTQEIIRALRPEELDELVAESRIEAAVAQGAFGPKAGWVAERAWRGKTKGYLLGRNSIVHSALHLGEALGVRSQAGLPLGL